MCIVHDVGVVRHKCPVEGFSFKAKQKIHVTKHLAHVHDVGARWFACPGNGCPYRAKRQGDVRSHFNRKHPESTLREGSIREVYPDESPSSVPPDTDAEEFVIEEGEGGTADTDSIGNDTD